MFLFALRSPNVPWFVALRRRMASMPVFSASAAALDEAMSGWSTHMFDILPFSYTGHTGVPLRGPEDVMVLEQLYYLGEGRVVGDARPMGLNLWLSQWPLPEFAHNPSVPKPSAGVIESSLAEFPWVAEHLDMKKVRRVAPPTRVPLDGDGEEDVEGAIEAAWQKILEQHDDWLRSPFDGDDFFVRFRSASAWSSHCAGSECICTEPKRLARAWCKLYKLQQTYTFPFAKLGTEVSVALAHETCRRYQWFFNLWKEEANPHFRYCPADMDGYAPDLAWVTFLDTLPHGSEQRERALMVDALVPQNP